MPVETQNQNVSKENTVLITGASSGFGFAACEVFLQKGWRVYAGVRGGEKRAELFKNLSSQFRDRFRILDLDLTDKEAIARVAETLRHGSLQALINNAGYGLFGAAEEMSEESLRQQMEVNFFGTVFLTQSLLPLLRASRGVIVTVSSVVGRHALPLTSGYCASKFAIEGFIESLSMELRPHGVANYLIEPGTFPTAFSSGIDWVESPPDSPYRLANLGYANLRSRTFASAKNRSIRSVGELMYRLVERRPSALRHPIGPDAKATTLAACFVPPNLFHRIATRTLNALQRYDVSARGEEKPEVSQSK